MKENNFKRNIKCILEYDGTGYHGWQIQENAITIQGVIEKAIRKLTGDHCDLTGSSRTDVGVHALGYTANFHTSSRIPPDRFAYALNSLLPYDIVIKKSEEADENFHARFSAKGKKYRYLIYNSPTPSALMRNRALHVPVLLDFDKMKSAGECFKGRHDFTAFMASGSSVKTTERTITDVSLKKLPDNIIQLEIAGDGFLYNMVRIITGTLVYVGQGKIKAEDIPDIIIGKDRVRAGKTAAAHGLYLVEVYY